MFGGEGANSKRQRLLASLFYDKVYLEQILKWSFRNLKQQ